jgi:hypothetical protein
MSEAAPDQELIGCRAVKTDWVALRPPRKLKRTERRHRGKGFLFQPTDDPKLTESDSGI